MLAKFLLLTGLSVSSKICRPLSFSQKIVKTCLSVLNTYELLFDIKIKAIFLYH